MGDTDSGQMLRMPNLEEVEAILNSEEDIEVKIAGNGQIMFLDSLPEHMKIKKCSNCGRNFLMGVKFDGDHCAWPCEKPTITREEILINTLRNDLEHQGAMLVKQTQENLRLQEKLKEYEGHLIDLAHLCYCPAEKFEINGGDVKGVCGTCDLGSDGRNKHYETCSLWIGWQLYEKTL